MLICRGPTLRRPQPPGRQALRPAAPAPPPRRPRPAGSVPGSARSSAPAPPASRPGPGGLSCRKGGWCLEHGVGCGGAGCGGVAVRAGQPPRGWGGVGLCMQGATRGPVGSHWRITSAGFPASRGLKLALLVVPHTAGPPMRSALRRTLDNNGGQGPARCLATVHGSRELAACLLPVL